MLPIIQLIFFVLFMIALGASVYFSIRYRREKDPTKRTLYQARNNISMGLMLIIFAVAQNFYFADTSVRRIFATICLLLGIFNFYVGLRNLLAYQKK